MKHRTFVFLGLAAVGLVAAVPVKADPIRIAQAPFPPYEIITIVRSTGLNPLSAPARRGNAYVLRAVDRYGEEVRVVVDAHRGRILSVQPVIPVSAPYEPMPPRYAPPRYYDPRYAPDPYYPPGYEYEPQAGYEIAPRPPARIPSVANAPGGKPVPAAKPASAAKASPAPKSAAATTNPLAIPAEPTEPAKPAAAVPETAGKASSAPASGIPPVQTFE